MTWTPSSEPFTERGADIEALRTLLATAVDHAGLFPPAGLNMSAAVAAFHEHGRGEHAWLLGSFVVPAGRLQELAEAVHALKAAGAGAPKAVEESGRGQAPGSTDPWPVSVIVSSSEEGAEAMELVRARLAEALRIAAFEVRPVGSRAVREKHEHLSGRSFEGLHVYYEVPLDGEAEARLDAIAAVGAHAKVRTGGVTADAFPEASEVVRFLRACERRGVAFKATAGLHHPFAGSYPLTYEAGSACAGMYGFLGLALTAGLIRHASIGDAEAEASLAAGPADLEARSDGLLWRGHAFMHDDLVDLRRDFFRSFGSCSFSEPVEELRRAGLLPVAESRTRRIISR